MPHIFTSTFATLAKKSEDRLQEISESSEASPKLPETNDLQSGNSGLEEAKKEEDQVNEKNSVQEDLSQSAEAEPENVFAVEEPEEQETEEGRSFSEVSDKKEENVSVDKEQEQVVESTEKAMTEEEEPMPANEAPTVEQRLKQITQEIEKYGSVENTDTADIGRQSFLSLSDLIRTLRPNDKNIPHIDSDYSNTMRVLGETSSFVNNNNNESRKIKNSGSEPEENRSLF